MQARDLISSSVHSAQSKPNVPVPSVSSMKAFSSIPASMVVTRAQMVMVEVPVEEMTATRAAGAARVRGAEMRAWDSGAKGGAGNVAGGNCQGERSSGQMMGGCKVDAAGGVSAGSSNVGSNGCGYQRCVWEQRIGTIEQVGARTMDFDSRELVVAVTEC